MYKRPGRPNYYAYLSRDQRHISLETDDEAQARLNLADLIHRRAAEGTPKKGDLGDVFVMCARRARTNHSQKHAYNLTIRLEKLATWLGDEGVTSPSRVSLGLVEKFKEAQREIGREPRTINRYLDAWKKAMKTAVDDGYAHARVLGCFRKLKEPQSEPNQRGLTMEEINAILCAAQDERDYWHWRTVAGSGMRDDEARHLEAGQVRDGSIVITPLPTGLCTCHPRGWSTKNYRYRTIPASPETTDAARRFAAVKHSMNLESKGVWKRLQTAGKAACIDWHWSMHDWRRAWGSHLLAAGLKLADISRWYGHRDLKTTMRYLRVVEDEMPDPDDLPL